MQKFSRLRWFTFLGLALGFGLLHGLILHWIISNSSSTVTVNDSLAVSKDGELLHVRVTYPEGRLEYRDEKGRILETKDVKQFRWTHDVSRYSRYRFQKWEPMLLGFSDRLKNQTKWYSIERADDPGLYFVGYEDSSKKIAGYIGRHGFSSEKPGAEDRFHFSPTKKVSLNERLQRNNERVLYWNREPTQDRYNDDIWLTTESTLFKIDLDIREVEEVAEVNPILGFGRYYGEDSERGYHVVLATDKEIIVVDQVGKQKVLLGIPPIALDADDYSYGELDKDRRLLMATSYNPFNLLQVEKMDIWWLNAEHNIIRHEHFVPKPEKPETHIVSLTAFARVPVPFIAFSEPAVNYYTWTLPEPTLGQQYSKHWNAYWPGGVAIIVSGLLVGIIAARHERRYLGKIRWAWVIAVTLIGWPGLLAYWFHRRWPSIGEDGRPIPLPAPAFAKTGTEIFAAA